MRGVSTGEKVKGENEMSLPKIDVPTFELEIPSTKQKVKMRYMRVKEEKILLMAKEGSDPGEILNSVKQVVQNCIVEAFDPKSFDLDNLAIFDIEFLFLRLRAQSVSDKAEVAYIDNDEVATAMEEIPGGDKKYDLEMAKAQRAATYTFNIDLNTVDVQFPEKLEKNVKVNDKVGVVLRFPPASLYSDKDFMNATGENLVNMLIKKSIETVYEGDKVTEMAKNPREKQELDEWIDSLDVKVYNKLKEFFTNLPHLFYEIKYTNKNGKDRTITLTTLNDFFSFV
jgi:hypothetical protein